MHCGGWDRGRAGKDRGRAGERHGWGRAGKARVIARKGERDVPQNFVCC